MPDLLGPSNSRLVRFCALFCLVMFAAGIALMAAQPREARAEREALDAAEIVEACLADEFCCIY